MSFVSRTATFLRKNGYKYVIQKYRVNDAQRKKSNSISSYNKGYGFSCEISYFHIHTFRNGESQLLLSCNKRSPPSVREEGQPKRRERPVLLFSTSVWISFVLQSSKHWGDRAYSLTSLSEDNKESNHSQLYYKGSTLHPVILKPWLLVRLGFEPPASCTAVRHSTTWTNRLAFDYS